MKKDAQKLVARAAARFMVEGLESEYLGAKERAVLMLGLGSQVRLPSNRQIKDCIALLTRDQLGDDEVARRLKEMRSIACDVMTVLAEFEVYLIGSTLSGKIRDTSDIDFHIYCDQPPYLIELLEEWGYEGVEEEQVENRKGSFVHLRWSEMGYPVEITVYPLSEVDQTPYSSVTGKPMKRATLAQVRTLVLSSENKT